MIHLKAGDFVRLTYAPHTLLIVAENAILYRLGGVLNYIGAFDIDGYYYPRLAEDLVFESVSKLERLLYLANRKVVVSNE
jgi:hypothetical protein